MRRWMSTVTFYRLCLWLPVLVPAVLIAIVNLFRLRDVVGLVGEILGYSLLYGGIPYAVVAIWATWWIGGRPETEIRRLMFRAPLLMLAVFVPLALLVGVMVGALVPWAAVAVLGGLIIVPLGYAYVALTIWLRSALGSRVV